MFEKRFSSRVVTKRLPGTAQSRPISNGPVKRTASTGIRLRKITIEFLRRLEISREKLDLRGHSFSITKVLIVPAAFANEFARPRRVAFEQSYVANPDSALGAVRLQFRRAIVCLQRLLIVGKLRPAISNLCIDAIRSSSDVRTEVEPF